MFSVLEMLYTMVTGKIPIDVKLRTNLICNVSLCCSSFMASCLKTSSFVSMLPKTVDLIKVVEEAVEADAVAHLATSKEVP